MLLAILEVSGVISALYSEEGNLSTKKGTVAAGYQNFIICVEMLFAAIALRFAFPHSLYRQSEPVPHGRTVSLQSISSNLKETMNPKDIMADAIHNFHPNYQQYTQQGTNIPHEELEYYRDREVQPPDTYQYSQHNGNAQPQHVQGAVTTAASQPTHLPAGQKQPTKGTGRRFNEKTTLLSSDDEFQ